MGNPVIALITCPHCGNGDATVHREAKGKRGLYYRCYGGPHGDCGTVQIRYEAGQRFISDNMRPLTPEQGEHEAKAAAIEEKERADEKIQKVRDEKKPDNPPAKKRGGLKAFFFDDEVEE